MTWPKPPDGAVQGYFEVSYGAKEGEIVSTYKLMHDATTDIIRVRAEMQQKALRYAVIEELRREGYTVIPPEVEET